MEHDKNVIKLPLKSALFSSCIMLHIKLKQPGTIWDLKTDYAPTKLFHSNQKIKKIYMKTVKNYDSWCISNEYMNILYMSALIQAITSEGALHLAALTQKSDFINIF